MKSLLSLWRCLAYELAGLCHTNAARDCETVTRRVEHEGLSFLTITLPAFSKDFEQSLERGCVPSDLFKSFSRKGGLPKFLRGFLQEVFDESGILRPTSDRSINCIFAIRQLCCLYAKILVDCSDERKQDAIDRFVVADQEALKWDSHASPELLQELERMSRLLFADVIPSFSESIRDEDLTPRHGPGAVAEPIRGNAKWDFATWPERLEESFPFSTWGVSNLRWAHLQDHVRFLSREEEEPSRLILVPKTLKTPRVIAAEPQALQYIQQALLSRLVPLLERDSVVGPMIGFSDQGPNREMARVGSRGGSLATLDLSEASDRVSYRQALSVLGWNPWVRDAISNTRSLMTSVPGLEKPLKLGKFAAMGSALCFPVEAMVFLTAVFLGIERATAQQRGSSRMTRHDVKKLHGKVRVYGDDIIIPVDCVDAVLETLSLYGWKVNSNKSFWNGKFRESCGGDFYDGEWVTPIRCRRNLPESVSDAEEVISAVSMRNQLYRAGLWATAFHLDGRLSKILGSSNYPRIRDTSPLLGRESFLPLTWGKMDKRLHKPLSRGFVVDAKIPINKIDDHAALLKCLVSPSEDPSHLQRSGRPVAVDLKLRWKTPY